MPTLCLYVVNLIITIVRDSAWVSVERNAYMNDKYNFVKLSTSDGQNFTIEVSENFRRKIGSNFGVRVLCEPAYEGELNNVKKRVNDFLEDYLKASLSMGNVRRPKVEIDDNCNRKDREFEFEFTIEE